MWADFRLGCCAKGEDQAKAGWNHQPRRGKRGVKGEVRAKWRIRELLTTDRIRTMFMPLVTEVLRSEKERC